MRSLPRGTAQLGDAGEQVIDIEGLEDDLDPGRGQRVAVLLDAVHRAGWAVQVSPAAERWR